MFRTTAAAAFAAVLFSIAPALAADVTVENAYARSSNPMAGAAFFALHNHADQPAKLVEVRSDVARSTDLHTNIIEDGIARMRPVDAIEIPAHGTAMLRRGGDHVMMMGLNGPWEQGKSFPLTLVFDDGTEQVIEVPIDNDRQDAPMDHGATGGGAMDHGKVDPGAKKHDH